VNEQGDDDDDYNVCETVLLLTRTLADLMQANYTQQRHTHYRQSPLLKSSNYTVVTCGKAHNIIPVLINLPEVCDSLKDYAKLVASCVYCCSQVKTKTVLVCQLKWCQLHLKLQEACNK